MGYNSEGSREDGGNSAGTGINVQGSGTVVVTIWKQELGGDWGDAQVPDGVTPSGSMMDHGDDSKTWGRQRLGVSSGRGGGGHGGSPPR